MKRHIILASGSPNRRMLLEQLQIPFEVVESKYEEDMSLPMPSEKLAVHLAKGKAQEVATRRKNHIVIGADTFIQCGKELLGKAHTPKMAKEMLRKISGKKIKVITGMCIIDSKTGTMKTTSQTEIAHVKKLSDKEINGYVKTGEPLQKGGAFAVQGIGAFMVKKIEGEYSGVVGLPLNKLVTILEKFGVSIF